MRFHQIDTIPFLPISNHIHCVSGTLVDDVKYMTYFEFEVKVEDLYDLKHQKTCPLTQQHLGLMSTNLDMTTTYDPF